jgi:hypothetical protein
VLGGAGSQLCGSKTVLSGAGRGLSVGAGFRSSAGSSSGSSGTVLVSNGVGGNSVPGVSSDERVQCGDTSVGEAGRVVDGTSTPSGGDYGPIAYGSWRSGSAAPGRRAVLCR